MTERVRASLALCAMALILFSSIGAPILGISEAWRGPIRRAGAGGPGTIDAQRDERFVSGFNVELPPFMSHLLRADMAKKGRGHEYYDEWMRRELNMTYSHLYGEWAREEFGMTESPESKPLSPSPGDWVVSGTEVREDEVIILTGNLTVEPGGNLTFINVTLYMNCTYDGEFQILVKSGGIFNVLSGSVITAYNPEYEFLFYVYGRLIMRDSELHECGYRYDYPGLWIESDEGVIIENCVISNNYDGVFCISSSNVSISECEISDNEGMGIYCAYSSNISIVNNIFIHDGILLWGDMVEDYVHEIQNNTVNGRPLCYVLNADGYTIPSDVGQVIVVDSSHVTISGINVSHADVGIEIAFSSYIAISECEISNNDGYGIVCCSSSHVSISRCEISNNRYDGISCSWYSLVVSITRCNISNNGDDGISLWWLTSDVSILGCRISNNGDDGIRIFHHTSNVVVHYCNITSNAGHGLYNSGTYVVNATYNWWGSPSGPEYKEEGDPYDPEEVYSKDGPEYLIYEPWLTEPGLVDTEPPILEITYPPEGEYIRGAITVSVDASDPSGIEKVEFYIDGSPVFTDYDHPYECVWDTTGYPDGTHTIKVIAYDKVGNVAEREVTITVDNTEPTIGEPAISPEAPTEEDDVTVKVSVTDALSGVEEVILSYSTDGGTTWSNMTMTLGPDGYYTATIPRQPAGTTVLYKIYALDKVGNQAVSPEYSYTVRAKPAPPALPAPLVIIASTVVVLAVIIALVVLWRRRGR